MKQLKCILAILFLIVTSCSDSENKEPTKPTEPTTEITIIGDEPVMNSKGGESDLSFTSSADWTIDVETSNGNEDWCTVSPTSGKAGKVMVTVTTKKNENYGDRTAYLKIKSGTKIKNVLVTQKKKDAILVSKDKYEVSTEGGTLSIEVEANIDYQVKVPEWCNDWITHNTNKGRSLKKTVETFSIAKGSLEENREGQIIFINGPLSDTVSVYQAIRKGIVLTSDRVNLTEESQYFDVELLTNVSYQVIIPDTLTWIKMALYRSLKVDKVSFIAEENTSYDNRSGKIIFRNVELNISDTLTVRQVQKDALVLSSKLIQTTGDQTTINVDLRTNIDYEIQIANEDQSWITQSKTRGLNTFNHSFSIAQNTTGEQRNGKIYFKDKESNFQDFVVIEQDIYMGERDILIKFYNALDGDNWTNSTNWCSDKPIDEWYGVEDFWGEIHIKLSSNNLKGEIPKEIFSFKKLSSLNLSNNYIVGGIPLEIANAKDLFNLNLMDNQLTSFDLPQSGVPNLRNLNLSYNPIEGSIPSTIGALSNLEYIYMQATLVSGGLPAEFVNLQKLVHLDLSHCTLRGWAPNLYHPNVLELVCELTNLRTLYLNGAGLTGTIPNNIKNLRNIQWLHLPYNNLVGTIPSAISQLSNIEQINFANNNLEGEIPSSITELHGLRSLNLANNNLTGTLPRGFENFVDMKSYPLQNIIIPLILSGNRLSGEIPKEIMQNPNYEEWDAEINILPQQDGYLLKIEGIDKYESSDYSKDGEVLTLQKSTRGNGIDLVFMGDGYVDRDMNPSGKYEQTMRRAMDEFFSIEPVKSYREYFNVYVVKAISKHEFVSPGSETIFEVEFGTGSYVYGNDDISSIYAQKAPIKTIDNTTVSIIVNSTKYAGTCGMYTSGASFAYIPDIRPIIGEPWTRFRGVLLHEALGHGFAKLADEYINFNEEIPYDNKEYLRYMQDTYDWYKNIDITNDPNKVRWSHFLSHPNFSYVGFYQGGYLYWQGVWRPEEYTSMNENDPYFSAPSREIIVKRIKKLAGEAYSWTEFLNKDKYEPARYWDTRMSKGKVERMPHTPPIIREGSPKKSGH